MMTVNLVNLLTTSREEHHENSLYRMLWGCPAIPFPLSAGHNVSDASSRTNVFEQNDTYLVCINTKTGKIRAKKNSDLNKDPNNICH